MSQAAQVTAPQPPDPVEALRSLPQAEVELIYHQAFQRNDTQALRWLGCVDRYFLLTCLLRRPDARDPWLFARCREVEADPDDHIDVWAREHYKSTIITFAGAIQEVLKDQEITIGIFSHDKPTAKAFVKQIKLELEENELLKSLYPDVLWANPKKEAPWWSEDTGIVVKRKGNPKEATIEPSGLVEGMSTGSHYQLRIYDDVVTEESVTTAEMIKKVTERYDLSQNLGRRGGRMWVIGTRYHFGDTYGVVMQRKVLKERRYAATDDGDFDGNPVFLTQEEWERKKKESSRPIVAAQMLQNPLAGSETKFNIQWLKFWELRPKRLNVYIVCDPSKGRQKTSDLTAVAVIGVDVNRNKYLLDGRRQLTSLSMRWKIIRDTYRRWERMEGIQSVFVGYEQYGMQTDLEYFEERMELEQFAFQIQELAWPREGPASKAQRIERLEPDFRSGKFLLPGVIKIDESGQYEPVDLMRKGKIQEAIAQNEKWRVAQPIIQIDQDGKVYDVLTGFLEEYMFYPFAPKNDFLDAMSRIYDMDAVPPIHYGDGPQGVPATEPEIYPDT